MSIQFPATSHTNLGESPSKWPKSPDIHNNLSLQAYESGKKKTHPAETRSVRVSTRTHLASYDAGASIVLSMMCAVRCSEFCYARTNSARALRVIWTRGHVAAHPYARRCRASAQYYIAYAMGVLRRRVARGFLFFFSVSPAVPPARGSSRGCWCGFWVCVFWGGETAVSLFEINRVVKRLSDENARFVSFCK